MFSLPLLVKHEPFEIDNSDAVSALYTFGLKLAAVNMPAHCRNTNTHTLGVIFRSQVVSSSHNFYHNVALALSQ